MELRQLRFFIGVAEELNFSRAAEKMAIAQPALSRQIQQLEDELGVLLFRRDKRNVALTAAGSYLLTQARQLRLLVADAAEQTRRIHHGLIGTLRIGHPGSALYSVLPDALAALHARYPDVTSSLSETAEEQLLDDLLRHRIDVALTRDVIDDEPLAQELLFAEPFALVVADEHPLTAGTFRDLGQCRHESFILPALGRSIRYTQQLMDLFTPYGFEPKPLYTSNFGATILRLVEKNLGLAILPISYQYGNSLRLRFLPLPARTELYVMWRRDDLNPVLHNFLQICRDTAAQLRFV